MSVLTGRKDYVDGLPSDYFEKEDVVKSAPQNSYNKHK